MTIAPTRVTSSVSPPWALDSWPPVFWQANLRWLPRFVHLATRITNPDGCCSPRSGHTIWGGFSSKGDAGMAWDWVEIGTGVVAMADPMAVLTNVQLIDGSGEVLPEPVTIVHLNRIVRRLRWQDEVIRRLELTMYDRLGKEA
jgi:hypothetical protein